MPMTEEQASTPSGAIDQSSADDGSESRSERRKPKAIEKLEERRERHLRRSRPYRVAVVIVGFVVVLGGIVTSGPVPGPGFLLLIVGLGLLALEFRWAARLLERAAEYGDRAQERAGQASTTQKVLAGVAGALAVAAFVVAAILWDIPLLPV